jgi:TolA-binding protein
VRPQRVRGVLVLLALACTPRAAHAASSDRVEDPAQQEEVEAFRAAQKRFEERMLELEEDTKSFVDFREQEELANVKAQYEETIASLLESKSQQREQAIARFETFLVRYPDLQYASHVRFRLAELWWEKTSEEWLAATAAYETKVNDPNTTLAELEAMGPEPKRDLSRPLELYQRIIADNRAKPPDQRYERLDGAYLMMGLVYNDTSSQQYDVALAKQAFTELIQVVPDSELADRSHLFLGNFAFAENQFDFALSEYNLVYQKGPEGKYFEDALYQLAWAKYKLNEFDDSLVWFTELLDRSEQKKLDSGKESVFAPDAKRFMAFSFADIAYDTDDDAVTIAKKHFAKTGPRAYERDVYLELADVLIRYTRPREAIATYELLQNDPRWVNEPDNPQHQIALINLYLTSVARDLEQAGSERIKFIERYSEGTPWWEANRSDPEALEVARAYIEASLLDVAIEYRVRAQESDRPADYALAAQKYEAYLEKFPISDDYYKQQYYYADSLKLAGEHDRALAEFEALVRSQRHHPYGDAAMYSLMDVRLQRMLSLGHEPDRPPTDATIERTYPAGETEIQVYALTDDRADFIASADSVLAHQFQPSTDPELPDYQVRVDERRGSILYLTGQILFYHNRFDEARKRFEELIERYPRTVEASYAAGLIVDSYNLEGNLEQVRAYSKRFTLNPPGPLAEVDPTRFSGTLEETTFMLATEMGAKDPLHAATAFLDFRKEFPNSKLAGDALFNAAFYYQQVGKVDDASRLYEQFVTQYPQDKRSKGLYFRLAANHEATFELDRAIDYYDKVLVHKDATPAEKADALFSRSFLMIGLGRHKEAAQGYERYNSEYSGQADREEVMFRAGEQWEKVSRGEAVAFYNRYKKTYPAANPDHYIEAEYRIYKLMEEEGASQANLRKQQGAIVASFERFANDGKPIGPKGHEYAAAAEYPELQKQFEAFADDKLSGNDTRDAKLLNDTKPVELKAFEDQVKTFISKYQNFEYNSGALLLQAKAALAYSDLGLSLKCPKGMSEEDCWLYEDILQEKVFPEFYAVEEVGINRLKELIAAAKEKKRHSVYVDEAMAELNTRRPAEYPAVKRELEGDTRFTSPVEVGPLRMPAPEPEPEPEPAPAPEGGP